MMGRAGTPSLAALSLAIAFAVAPGDGRAQEGMQRAPKADQEIAPFRLTGLEGYLQMRYLADETTFPQRTAGTGLRTRLSNLVEEVFILSHSYIYHPRLLSLDVGGGPVFDRSWHEVDGVSRQRNSPQYNLTARATVLRDKPYTGELFYDRRNQTQSLGPALALTTRNTRYGTSLSLRDPVTPVPMTLELASSDNDGRDDAQVINDRTRQARFTTSANLGKLGSSTFQYLGSRQDSASGSFGRPIQTSRFDTTTALLETRLKLGPADRYDLSNRVAFNTSRYRVTEGLPSRLRNLSFALDLRDRHSDVLQTYEHYDFNSSKQGDQAATVHAASAGLSYAFGTGLSGALAGRGESYRGSHLGYSLWALDASMQYQKALPLGQATLSYNASYSRRDQQAMAQGSRLLGEHVTLAGTSPVTLGKPQVLLGSVMVSNLSRTQTFLEDRDYVLTRIGLGVRIQRLIGGNIVDGQEVLIDYDFDVGGTYALSQFDNSVALTWAYEFLSLSARRSETTPRLDSGSPTTPLNPSRTTVYRIGADFPLSLLWQQVLLGGSAERENRRDRILPYRRGNYETYAQLELPLVQTGSIRIGSRRLEVDYDNRLAQGVRLRAYDLRLWLRLANGVEISADATHERDTGTPALRERSLRSLKAQWRVRKLLWTLDVTRTHDLQGPAETTRIFGQMRLRRDF